ncbi:MAG TPA: ribonuclease HI [Steroidobacteraceae bacterium]
MSEVTIWTDGACRGNPGPGGWAAVLIKDHHEKELTGAEPETTNNRMELTAAIQGLRALKRRCRVRLFTDSEYLKRGITEWLENWKRRGWKTSDRKPVKNLDLWQEIEALTAKHDIEWHWVRAHSGIPENERVDQLANRAIDEMVRKRLTVDS